ncbi:unnamed protein product [Camellia sinensis]
MYQKSVCMDPLMDWTICCNHECNILSSTMSEKPKTSERIDERYFSKIVEDFSSRAMKLESDLFRLNKTASIGW